MWQVKTKGFNKDEIIHNGNKFLIGNGFMGYRGTLEEFKQDEFVALNLPGVYDKYQDKWREPVNASNPLYTEVIYNGNVLNPLKITPNHHEQVIDMRCGTFKRHTIWEIDDTMFEIASERFMSLKNINLMAMKYTIKTNKDTSITLKTGIDLDVWDINGPHLENKEIKIEDDYITVLSNTKEKNIPVVVVEKVLLDIECEYIDKTLRQYKINLKKDKAITFYKFVYINHHDLKNEKKELKQVVSLGYDELYKENKKEWDKRWEISDVMIKGDDNAQFALRYSIYHLIIISQQHSDKVSIPARGISGQTYKGAVFWDTEMFMLPYYLLTDLKTALNLVKYRIHTLDGARRKAKEYGYRGAFYAWESQETGDDACTHFNVTDVFTHRPMRTYFRDKQIHISADIVYAIYQTYLRLEDDDLLLNGGAEVILECARFYLSYGYQNVFSEEFELLDVTGPDEYHERVNNNAYTNRMVKETFSIALKVIKLFKDKYPIQYEKMMVELNYHEDYKKIKDIINRVYLQQPNEKQLIEQFDGYFKLEDTTVDDIKKRLLHPKEYWGGANGVATHTQVIKQADVVTMLYLFQDEFNDEIRKINWDYYEKRCEHGSSLSACMYALVACLNQNPDWAYPYFMKSASVDLEGKSKQFAGDIYIGGTHPAASGGAYMTAIYGFAGLHIKNNELTVNPQLPHHFEGMNFKILIQNKKYEININKDIVHIEEMKTC